MKQFHRHILLLTAVSIISGATVTKIQAQAGHLNAENMAMGGGGTAFIDGYHANFINPANLTLNYSRKTNVEIGLIGIGASAGGSLANISAYNKYFTNDVVLEGETADEALNGLFGADENGLNTVGLNADVVPLGIRIQQSNWAFSIAGRSRALFRFGANRGTGKLLLKGPNSEEFSEATPVNFSNEIFFLSEISLGFARRFLDVNIPILADNVSLSVGVAPKILLGMHYSKFEMRSTLQIQETNPRQFRYLHDFEYNIQVSGDQAEQLRRFSEANQPPNNTADFGDFFNPDGEDFSKFEDIGLGLDVGATIEIDIEPNRQQSSVNTLNISASVTDIGSVAFNTAGSFSNKQLFDWQGVSNLDLERIEEEFNNDTGNFLEFVFSDSLGSGIYGNFSPDNNEVKAKLPTRFNVGSYWQVGKLGFSLDVSTGLRDIGMDGSNNSFSVGASYQFLGFIPVRAGMRTGGVASAVYSVGTGFDFDHFTFTVAVSSTGDNASEGSILGAAWSGIVLRF